MSSRRRKKRYRVRYDRIVGAAAILIVLIILLVSCGKSCGKSRKKGDESSVVPTSSQEDKDKENQQATGDESSGTEEPGASLSGMTFTTISAMPNEVFSGDLVLVNKDHEFSFPATEADANLVKVCDKTNNCYMYNDVYTSLREHALNAFNDMMQSYKNAGGSNDVVLAAGYRTKEEQDEVQDTEVPGGYSDLHTGLSVYLTIIDGEGNSYYYVPEDEHSWIADNCAKYGFILRYPADKERYTGLESRTYQFRYVGVPHALYMTQSKLCLEEYIDLLRNYTSSGEHLEVEDGSKKYEIYYVPADPSANTDIPVPDDKKYTVSGNNVDGFIVTAEV